MRRRPIQAIQSILTPIDFSENVGKIVKSAAYVAGTFKAELHLVFVAQTFEDYSGFFVPPISLPNMEEELFASAQQQMETYVEEQRAALTEAGVTNVKFLKGEIEDIPLPDNSVDLIISNCVINLSSDKSRVFNEAFRVLKPGGRLAVSDIVVRGAILPEIRHSVELWAGCVAGALDEEDYLARLRAAGFDQVNLEPTRIYTADDARDFILGAGLDADVVAKAVDGKFLSGFIRATKPLAERSCCSPSCCS